MTARYAATTTVPPEKSRGEIERALVNYGAKKFMYGWGEEEAVLAFVLHEKQIRFMLPLPHRGDYRINPKTMRTRTPEQLEAAYEQDVRQCWRALLLVIKAKLEAVAAEIVSFEQEFMAHIVMPDGSLVGDLVLPKINEAYISGGPVDLLPSRQLALPAGSSDGA